MVLVRVVALGDSHTNPPRVGYHQRQQSPWVPHQSDHRSLVHVRVESCTELCVEASAGSDLGANLSQGCLPTFHLLGPSENNYHEDQPS